MRFSLPIQLLAIITFTLAFGTFLPVKVIELFFTFSVLFKEFLGFLLPFIVFFFVFTGIMAFKKNAPYVLLILLACIFFSNASTALMSYFVMELLFPIVSSCTAFLPKDFSPDIIKPFFSISLPPIIKTEYALLLALIGGICFSFIRWNAFEQMMFKIKEGMENFVNHVIISCLPFYVLGFLLKIRYEGALLFLLKEYSGTFIIIVTIQIAYLFWMYILSAWFHLKTALQYITNALPSYITAFSTMSSTATIPVSIRTAEKNTYNQPLSTMAMPIMANVHLLGDCISTPILAMVTLLLFKGCLPSFMAYLGFVLYFCTSMFAVSGIPGGGIIVMIPILISQFGFNAEMISIITALYLLLDAFGTAANVMGDGALVIIVNKIMKKVGLADD